MRGRRFLRSFQPDILHSHTFPANMMARGFHAAGEAPRVVSTIHNVYEGGHLRTLAYRGTDRFCLLNTAVSEAVADRYIAIGAVPRHKVSVITNGIDLKQFSVQVHRGAMSRRFSSSNGNFVWLAAGRDVPAKDFDNLITAFQRVRAEARKTELWIAGELHKERSMQVGRLHGGVEGDELEGVRWLGYQRDMQEVIAASDAFVLSSAWEGMPLVVGEAMAMGKPVVATDVGGVRELVGDAGLLARAKDPQALAQAMLRVMEMREEERNAIGTAARQRIGQLFDMNAKVAEWEALYARLLCDRR